MWNARAALIAASMPCIRRGPKSTTGARGRRYDACRLGCEHRLQMTWFMTNVSASCACAIGAVTSRIGSFSKTGVPSGTASTSPVKRNPSSHWRKRR